MTAFLFHILCRFQTETMDVSNSDSAAQIMPVTEIMITGKGGRARSRWHGALQFGNISAPQQPRSVCAAL